LKVLFVLVLSRKQGMDEVDDRDDMDLQNIPVRILA